MHYYCKMESRLTNLEIKAILLRNGQKYFYTITPVEIKNILGTSITLLQEYSITDLNGKNHKLYKTKEGNWYDMAEATYVVDNAILMTLKSAINSQEIKD